MSRRSATIALTLLVALLSQAAFGHPADEFCSGDSGLDPALCRALSEMDSAEQNPGRTVGGTELVTVEIDRPWHEVAALYSKLGVQHIVPKGLDHILFVLALFLASTRWRPLLIQVSVFTVAHTLTLALAASGKVSVSGAIVEPLIALSIAFVAVENLVFRDMSRWRPLVVFFFGLFHGLGFASVLQGLGLPEGQFLVALVSFNVGVEIGQISVIAVAWILLHRLYRSAHYRSRVVIPTSFAIAVTGLWWAVQRVFLT